MSTLETIINPKQRKAKKGTKSAQADAIYQALDSMEAHVLPLSVLVQSELNVRKRAQSMKKPCQNWQTVFKRSGCYKTWWFTRWTMTSTGLQRVNVD